MIRKKKNKRAGAARTPKPKASARRVARPTAARATRARDAAPAVVPTGDGQPASAAVAVLERPIARAGKGPTAVVGVGASAGGFEAFRQFIGLVPADSGLAFVLIQHLDPNHPSLTAELMRRHTSMPVVEAEEGMGIEADHVYVIPPNRYLAVDGMKLRLTPPAERRGLRVPIDFFFRSLAHDQQERAIGIILSGTGTDGTLGLREIKAAGGLVIVQAPETAIHEGMSRSAIATGLVDYVLSVDRMADALIRYVRHWYVNGGGEPPAWGAPESDHVHAILGLLQARGRFDFSGYKKGTLSRRIQRRMGLHHFERPAAYVEFLGRNMDEVKALQQDLLINVTSFFREPKAWEALEELVIAPMVRDLPEGRPIRAWVAGCATGEEAYTLAILLAEHCETSGKGRELQVFASDIDSEALALARLGVYPENIAVDVSPQRLRRFFTRAGDTYRVNRVLRESVVFAQQNVISDPPFSKLDLICCRNLLIYLEADVQRHVLSQFHFALIEGGRLLLGGSETIGDRLNLFRPLSRKHRVFGRIGSGAGPRTTVPAHMDRSKWPAPGRAAVQPGDRHAVMVAQRLMMARFAPACAMINSRGEVLYLHGPLDRFLQVPAGEPTSDLVSMVREEFRSMVRTAVDKATKSGRRVIVGGGPRRDRTKSARFRLTVEPLAVPGAPPGLLLVSFEDGTRDRPGREPPEVKSPATSFERGPKATIRRLEEDVRAAREDLRTSLDDLATSNEEFRASNEEVTSINEELQSTNEELETSKEELQSLNEELQTVNSQLEVKVQELEGANDDLTNLFASAEIATVFLDHDLRIRRFTPGAQKLLPMTAGDLGRPLADLAPNVDDPDLLPDAGRVLQSLSPIEREAPDREGRSYLRRTFPYRTEDNRIEGVVITFSDITVVKQQTDELRRLNQELETRVRRRTGEVRRLIEATADATLVVNARGKILEVNRRTEQLFGWSRDELVGQSIEFLVPERLRHSHLTDRAKYLEDLIARPMGAGLDLFGRRKDGSEFALDVQLSPTEMDDQPVVIASIRDVTERKAAEALRTRLAAIVQSSSTAIVLLDLDGTIRSWNRGAEKMFGYPSDEAIGRHISLLFPPERSEEFTRNVERLGRDEKVEDFETVRLHRDRKRLDVALTMSLVTDDHGRASGLCAIYSDIGPRKEQEAQMADLVERERQRVGQELHDTLGQQLTALGMLTSSLRSAAGQDPERAATVGRLEQLVDQSKGQLRSLIAGVFPVAVEPDRLMWSLRDLAHETSRMYGVTCRVEGETALELEDAFVATQLFLIAREAVHNAVRHARAKEIVIRLEGHGVTRLWVSDDGQGMPATVDETASMGLRIMRHRSNLIGGRLGVNPRPEGGTVVAVERWPSGKNAEAGGGGRLSS